MGIPPNLAPYRGTILENISNLNIRKKFMLPNQKEPAKLITLTELFDGRKFEVPDYQRGYSWEEKHVNALLTDIERHRSGSGHKHFTGTIVVEKPNRKTVYKLVDGQQRLVTCVMILRAIAQIKSDSVEGITNILNKNGSTFYSDLTLGEQDRAFFQDSILNFKHGVPIKTSSNERLIEGYATINTWLKNHEDKIAEIQHKLLNELGFIFFEAISDKEANTMFEVINNRGKEISELEKIKNYYLHLANLYDLGEISEKINAEWLGILENLELAGIKSIYQENKFFRNVFSIVVWKVKRNVGDLYELYKDFTETELNDDYDEKRDGYSLGDIIFNKNSEIYDTIDLLSTSASAYAFLFSRNDIIKIEVAKYSLKFNDMLRKLRNHGIERGFMPVYLSLIYLLLKFPQKTDKIINCLDVLEKLSFRVFSLPKVSDRETKKSDFIDSYASDIFYGRILVDESIYSEEFAEHAQKDEFYDKIQNDLINFIRDNRDASNFVAYLTASHFTNFDTASWGSLKFFLAKYEHSLRNNDPNWDYETLCTNDKNGVKLSIEHLLAVKNKTLYEKEQHVEKRRLGNFILVEQDFNQKLSTKGIKEKIIFIDKHIPQNIRLKHVHELVTQYYQLVDGTMKDGNNTKAKQQRVVQTLFDYRETNMIKFALEEWRYPGEPSYEFEKIDSLQAERDKRQSRYYPNYDA